METPVLVALITALFALAMSIINVVSNARLARSGARANMTLEAFKAQKTLVSSENEGTLRALNSGISAIQALKDELWLVVQAVPASLDHCESLTSLSGAVEQVICSFEASDPFLTPEQRKPFHRAKNAAIELRQVIHSFSDITQLPSAGRRNLLSTRDELTNFQNELRDRKIDTLFLMRQGL